MLFLKQTIKIDLKFIKKINYSYIVKRIQKHHLKDNTNSSLISSNKPTLVIGAKNLLQKKY